MPSRQFNRLMLAASATFAMPFLSGAALAGSKQEIAYHLPRASVGITLTHTLVSCPTAGQAEPDRKLVIKSKWTVESVAEADPEARVTVDVSSGFLAKRSNVFVFYPNGTVSGFNGSSEGQSGTVIASALKLAGTVLPMLGTAGDPVSPASVRYCSEQAMAALDLARQTEVQIAELEDKIARDEVGPAQVSVLDTLKQRLAGIRKKLILKDAVSLPTGEGSLPDEDKTWTAKLEAMKMEEKWFTVNRPATRPDAVGFKTEAFEQDRNYMVRVRNSDNLASTEVTDLSSLKHATRDLVYRWPAPAHVQVGNEFCKVESVNPGAAKPTNGVDAGVGAVVAEPAKSCWETLELDAPLVIPQWGKLARLPVGNAGLFGSRQAAAKFTPFGQPTELSYGSESGAGAIASSIDAGTGLATTLRDAETAALERKIKRLELEAKLEALEAEAKEGE